MPVHGLVTLDGEPLARAVMKHTGGLNMATGVTKDDGRFELAIHKRGKGATPGSSRPPCTVSTAFETLDGLR